MRRAAFVTTLLMLSCEGRIGESAAPPTIDADGPVPTPFVCDGQPTQLDLPLRRLSHAEYANTLHAFLAAAAPTSASAIESALAADLGQVPNDRVVPMPGEKHGGFSRLDQLVQQATVDSTYLVAVGAGRELTSSSARLRELMGTCATDTNTANDAQCLRDLVNKLGALSQRHPLSTADADFLVQTAGATPVDPAAVADVVAVMLLWPGFLYHLEEGTTEVADRVFALDGYELAARLSYHLWESPPDDALRAAAANGSLLTDEGYAAQLARLTGDGRADDTLDAFFGQWFRLGELGALNSRVGSPLYDAFAGADVPSGDLRGAMFDEVLSAARWQAHHGGTLDDLMADRRNFATSAELAKLYGTTAWDGVSEPPALPAARSGLLTRGAFLANDSANTRPVMKGLRLRNALLCDAVPPPPDNVKAVPPELAPDLTTREVLEGLTEQPGTSCVACHGGLLNPMGFASEGFDALGRARTVQTLFDAAGQVTAQKPVNTRSIARVTPEEGRATADIAGVTQRIVTSQKFDTCFARQYFRFTFRRPEVDAQDGCSLKAFDEAARAGKLTDALGAAALRPEFKRRRILP